MDNVHHCGKIVLPTERMAVKVSQKIPGTEPYPCGPVFHVRNIEKRETRNKRRKPKRRKDYKANVLADPERRAAYLQKENARKKDLKKRHREAARIS